MTEPATSGAARQVQMMKHTAEYRYANADGLEVIRLPYADGTFAMYVVLPQDAARMQSFVEKLTPEAFTELLSSLRTQNGTIELPRFTTKYDATLNTVLKKLGMGIAFSDSANFNDISKAPKQFQISEVRHASFLSVDEEGTEAAAATSVGIRATAMRVEPPPFHMVVDHPFCVAIREDDHACGFMRSLHCLNGGTRSPGFRSVVRPVLHLTTYVPMSNGEIQRHM